MEIGFVQWFGGVKKDGRHLNFGVLQSVLDGKTYRFYIKNVKNSPLFSAILKQTLLPVDCNENLPVNPNSSEVAVPVIFSFSGNNDDLVVEDVYALSEQSGDFLRIALPQDTLLSSDIAGMILKKFPDFYDNVPLLFWLDVVEDDVAFSRLKELISNRAFTADQFLNSLKDRLARGFVNNRIWLLVDEFSLSDDDLDCVFSLAVKYDIDITSFFYKHSDLIVKYAGFLFHSPERSVVSLLKNIKDELTDENRFVLLGATENIQFKSAICKGFDSSVLLMHAELWNCLSAWDAYDLVSKAKYSSQVKVEQIYSFVSSYILNTVSTGGLQRKSLCYDIINLVGSDFLLLHPEVWDRFSDVDSLAILADKVNWSEPSENASRLWELIQQFSINEKQKFYHRVPGAWLLKHNEIWHEFDDKLMLRLLDIVDISKLDEQTLSFINSLEADLFPETSFKLIRKLCSRFPVKVFWPLLTDSCKVRALIWWASNPYLSKADLVVIANYELDRLPAVDDAWLLLALIKFLKMKYIPVDHHQQAFLGDEEDLLRANANYINSHFSLKSFDDVSIAKLGAHGCLMKYLSLAFDGDKAVSHAAVVTLVKCRADRKSSKTYLINPQFCDGKSFDNKVYCPRGADSVHECSGHICKYLSKLGKSDSVDDKEATIRPAYHDILDMLQAINPSVDFTVIGVNSLVEYPYKISAYVNCLVSMWAHMKCSRCGKRLVTDMFYSLKPDARVSASVAYCPDCSLSVADHCQHDRDIYLNYCWNCRDTMIIDNRECHQQYGNRWLCMRCGASIREEDATLDFPFLPPGKMCPNCGNTDTNLLSADYDNSGRVKYITCQKCNYDGSMFDILQNASCADDEALPF